MKIVLLFLFVAGLLASQAQTCSPGNFDSQSAISDFHTNYPGCTQIIGNMNISASDITDLSGLSGITLVTGTVYIGSNQNLPNLSGLNDLTTVNGAFFVSNNALLEDLSGLNGLQQVQQDIWIANNNSLENLSGLNSLQQISNGLIISNNPSLTTLTGLSSLQTISGTLNISNNPLLSSIAGLSALSSPIYSIRMGNNSALTSLTGLNGITTIGSGGLFLSNTSLTNLQGLNNLVSVNGEFRLANNSVLSDLSALDNLQSISTTLWIADNNGFTNFSGFHNLNSLDQLYLLNTGFNTLAGFDHLSSLGVLSLSGNNSLASLNGLNLNTLGGINFQDNNMLSNLSALSSISSMSYGLTIYNHPSLASLNGLHNLGSVGSMQIVNNDALTNLTALQNLTSAGSYIDISNNNALADLSGLSNIDQSVINEWYLYNNSPGLSNCAIQSICTYIQQINDRTIVISNNASGCNSVAEVSTACAVLPVELHHFSAQVEGQYCNINWQTYSESNIMHFIVEHSVDGVFFQEIGIVKAMGSSNGPRDYQYVHEEHLKPGIQYYRLKIVDNNASFSYSSMVQVMVGKSKDFFALAPNPAFGTSVRMLFNPPAEEPLQIDIFDTMGATVLSITVPEGITTYEMDIAHLSTGNYLIKALSGQLLMTDRLLIRH